MIRIIPRRFCGMDGHEVHFDSGSWTFVAGSRRDALVYAAAAERQLRSVIDTTCTEVSS
jgi:hypothetical protein